MVNYSELYKVHVLKVLTREDFHDKTVFFYFINIVFTASTYNITYSLRFEVHYTSTHSIIINTRLFHKGCMLFICIGKAAFELFFKNSLRNCPFFYSSQLFSVHLIAATGISRHRKWKILFSSFMYDNDGDVLLRRKGCL